MLAPGHRTPVLMASTMLLEKGVDSMDNQTMDRRIPVDKEAVLRMFDRLPQPAKIGILSSLSVMLSTPTDGMKTS